MLVALLRKMLGEDEKKGHCHLDRLRQIDAFSRKPNAITGIGSYTNAADFDLFHVGRSKPVFNGPLDSTFMHVEAFLTQISDAFPDGFDRSIGSDAPV